MSDLVSSYNPDVLSCIANLSNDEVFTPPEVANAMLDMLPQELFSDPNTTFLDPATKSGVFLREIAKRLLVGLEPTIPDLQERLDHIMHKQLYGISITELTSLLSRRSLYCSKYPNSIYSVSVFDDIQGNIRFKNIKHRFKDKRCVYCGAAEAEYGDDKRSGLEQHAYEFIHNTNPQEIFKMKFDVIIGNPPYQLETGGGSEDSVAARQAKPLFHLFVQQAMKMNPKYLCMIIPARWYSGGIGLNDFRDLMLKNSNITDLVDYFNSRDCFDNVNIAGGICYFLWARDIKAKCRVTNILGRDIDTSIRSLDEFGDIFIRSNKAISIIHKVLDKTEDFLTEKVYPIDAFGFVSKSRGNTESFDGAIKLIHSKGTGYVGRDEVAKNREIIDKFKVTIGILVPSNGEVGIDPSKGYNGITKPRILRPGEVTTFSYLVIGVFDTLTEAVNYQRYIAGKFARFMLRLTYSSMHISKNNFRFVPLLDFNKEWEDEELYSFYGLSEQEISYIEFLVRPMDLD